MPTAPHLPVYIGPEALARLVAYCRERGLSELALVADHNTYAALGRAAQDALSTAGFDVLPILLEGDDIVADARYVLDVLLALDRTPRTFVAAGSGTLTDITRFVSHRAGREFISLPTAPSVDGFTSIGAPMLIHGLKITVPCQGPSAVFADLPALCAAPRPMIAAGFGDMLGKITSVSDWQLGALLWDEPYDADIARRSRAAAWACIRAVDSIAAAECDGVQALMEGLIESGFCMLDFGETRPASGYEHHVSHLWEMKLLREGRHSVLHGAKVGIAVIHSLRLYRTLAGLSRADAEGLLARSRLLPRDVQVDGIRRAFGPLAGDVIALQQPFLDMTEAGFVALKQKIIDRWDEVQAIARAMPGPDEMIAWLRQIGGPVEGSEVGLNGDEVNLGLQYGHYYRRRFTIAKLMQVLGLGLLGDNHD